MKRLYRKIYLAILGSLLLVVLLAGAAWQLGGQRPSDEALELGGILATASLPPASASQATQQTALSSLAERLDTDLALYDPDRRLIAATASDMAEPDRREHGGWTYGSGGPAWTIVLADGRRLVVSISRDHRNPVVGLVLLVGVIAVAVGIGAYPVARGLTRRLERLKAGVETLGAGDLGARVTVEGKDEVAHLAESFNEAATRIEELVGAHRMMLASASHELRTPLARIRLGLDLLESRPSEKLKAEIRKDIAELDHLIDEILLASRLDQAPTLSIEDVDLQALCAEECARFDACAFDGEAAIIRGDPTLLRRLVRNLLENADRHGRPPVRMRLHRKANGFVLDVLDGGEGVPASEEHRVFDPFFRLGGESSGAGLGLALVRRIARLHGGDAVVKPSAESGMGGFRVFLRPV